MCRKVTCNSLLFEQNLERLTRRKELRMKHLLLPKTPELAKEFLRLAEQIAADFGVKSEDARRLDWLADPSNAIGNVHLPKGCVETNESLRGAIDMAMRMDKAPNALFSDAD